MAKLKQKNASEAGLKLKIEGDWTRVVAACERTGTILEKISPEDIGDEVTEDELDRLREDWECWKPQSGDDYSSEMREKTAKQSSINATEEKDDDIENSMEKAADSAKKVTDNVERGNLNEAKDNFSEAVKETGKVINSKVRNGARKVEKQIYEKVILKVNSLYFDNSVLNAVLSKRLNAGSSEEYEFVIHSNNPYLRNLMAKEIDWDEC